MTESERDRFLIDVPLRTGRARATGRPLPSRFTRIYFARYTAVIADIFWRYLFVDGIPDTAQAGEHGHHGRRLSGRHLEFDPHHLHLRGKLGGLATVNAQRVRGRHCVHGGRLDVDVRGSPTVRGQEESVLRLQHR